VKVLGTCSRAERYLQTSVCQYCSSDNVHLWYSHKRVVQINREIDLIQKSTNQRGQKWQLFLYFRFSVIRFLCYCNNQKLNLLRNQAHTFSLFQQHKKYNYTKLDEN
jgi:hypothetical protein